MTEAASSGAAMGAMSGLRVIDLTRVLGGPYCTQILADHGADVIKVEPPAGDEVRDWGPPFHEEDAAYFIGINRNKRSIGLDLASEGGRTVLLKMLESADVLIENFKPGTLEKWGIGNEVLREKFPRLVHCRICGFGADGPRGGNPGYDAIIQAMTGMIAATGSPESGPMRIGVPLVDIGTGLYAAIGILMALSERQRSGQGQFLETTLYETGLAIMHPHTANYFMHGKPPSLTGNEHPNLVPYAIFPTKTDDSSSSASAMTAPSASSPRRSASPSSAPIRALRATRIASAIARRCGPSLPPCSASTRPSRCAIACSPRACPPAPCRRSTRH
ncbi:crotonobetainyl-CoA:carnitine CoA-transferase CaiB-like acyl-CoA transferase [Bradyrhizobium sp. GM6.1]